MDTLRLIPADLTQAATLLRSGELVAFPTETVYGLGANALDPSAVEKIFAAKQRPHWDPLIVHIAEASQLPTIAYTSPAAEALMEAFWPGPLTLLLPKAEAIPDIVTSGRSHVGVRIPSHPLALALLREAAMPIAAPSANTFGHTSPTSADHVLADLDGRIAAVLDGGPTTVGLESTVAEVRDGQVILYRPGAITLEMIETITGSGSASFFSPQPEDSVSVESLPSPGVGIRHYAPRARLILTAADAKDPEHSMLDEMSTYTASGASIGLMLPNGWAALPGTQTFLWGDWNNPTELAQRLFEGLRYLDDRAVDFILCPLPELSGGLTAAIRDRLEKAARSA